MQGDAIQAIVHNKDQKYVDSKINVLKCYRIESYVCVPVSSAINIMSHSVYLGIGAATSIDSIPDTAVLPHQYFEFCECEKLDTRRSDGHQVIDFIGLLQGVEEKNNQRSQAIFELDTYKCQFCTICSQLILTIKASRQLYGKKP
ncbi:hypothetical protein L1987_12226 [Smallanthus sonchifolius]|uniref:Uncharacterized protein n=1 Tax=Smallanthus sonchifolius TaxID=185202 RepID=A0ACB9JFT4_9ASTR|nr:hypothetical protein L1987_12226 [Smallanthus sonchifolius]